MPIRIECIDCGFRCLVRDHLAGRVVECPRCRSGIRVVSPSNAPPPAVPRSPAPRSGSRPGAPADVGSIDVPMAEVVDDEDDPTRVLAIDGEESLDALIVDDDEPDDDGPSQARD